MYAKIEKTILGAVKTEEGGCYVIITSNIYGNYSGTDRIFASQQFRTSGAF